MAPEVYKSEGYSETVDCYAWAHLLAEMLTLVQPYDSYRLALRLILHVYTAATAVTYRLRCADALCLSWFDSSCRMCVCRALQY